MRFYIATSLERADDHNIVRDGLRALGHEVTYDWTVHGAVAHLGRPALVKTSVLELQGIIEADAIIALVPGGKGTHTELGFALGLLQMGKKIDVYVCAEPESNMLKVHEATCAFYWHPNVRRCRVELAAVAATIDSWIPGEDHAPR